MNKYILLRNNKENGPYTLEEITAKGFKAYDLIWIEGRSAGWRYPSEVAELKPYAPVIEEQPYDRFYKKPAKQTEIPIGNTQSAIGNEQQVFQSLVKIPIAATRKIYVTLPGEGTKPVFIETEKQKSVEQKIIKEQNPETIINDEPIVLQEKYFQPLDEIKKLYVNQVLQQKKKPLKGIVINEKIKLAALAFTLLLSGTAVGLFINRDKSTVPTAIANLPVQLTSNPSNTEEPVAEKLINKTKPVIEQPSSKIISAEKNSKLLKEEKIILKPIIPKSREITDVAKQPATIKQKQSTVQTAAKENSLTAQEEEQKATVRKNLGKEINIIASNYKKATFGGISNLEFTVFNNTAYTIDMVIAEVDYFTAGKKIYKTETVYFKNIAPNGSQVQAAPNSNRGYEVKYRISLISSKELGIYTAGL